MPSSAFFSSISRRSLATSPRSRSTSCDGSLSKTSDRLFCASRFESRAFSSTMLENWTRCRCKSSKSDLSRTLSDRSLAVRRTIPRLPSTAPIMNVVNFVMTGICRRPRCLSNRDFTTASPLLAGEFFLSSSLSASARFNLRLALGLFQVGKLVVFGREGSAPSGEWRLLSAYKTLGTSSREVTFKEALEGSLARRANENSPAHRFIGGWQVATQ